MFCIFYLIIRLLGGWLASKTGCDSFGERCDWSVFLEAVLCIMLQGLLLMWQIMWNIMIASYAVAGLSDWASTLFYQI